MGGVRKRLTFANVMSVIAVFIALGGAAVAATKIPKNSVGTKQLKNGAVTGEKVASGTLTGANINVGTLPKVPSAATADTALSATHADTASTADAATTATHANSADTAQVATHALSADTADMTHADTADLTDEALRLNGHKAGCPTGSTPIHGICFDITLQGPVDGVKAASTACSNAGGFLPDPMTLYSARTVVNLGDGIPPNYAVSSAYYADNFAYKGIVVDGSGVTQEIEAASSTKYICMYPLVR